METLWLIPVHVRPVVSYEGLTGGGIRDPVTGLDRFNLTDVGEAFYRNLPSVGFHVRLKSVELPFPWEMIFSLYEEPTVSLKGLRIGPSTFRSIFRLIFEDEPSVRKFVISTVMSLSRDPLESPYWDDETWEVFQHRFRMSRANVVDSNRLVLRSP
ncbi:MAG: hypothetical protein JW939_00285 [Candidatus Thermoplasmatota archaeon]|nr:hypothetical protein [Candidatus Thermoplasmatota archaeon]